MVIARIADSVTDAADRAIQTAHRAETAGWRNVTVTPDIQRGTYNVAADEPADTTGR
jgi:acyl-CoA reductase-like NAD-dependent aldehyde dehydrogenase